MMRTFMAAAALALLAAAPDGLAQSPTQTTPAPCRPTASKPCPPPGPQKTITYQDPFKPDTKSGSSKPDDNDGWNLPRVKLDNDTTLGIGGLERKF